MNYGVDTNTSLDAVVPYYHVKLTAGNSWLGDLSLLTLNLAGSGSLALGASNTLTLTDGGLIKSGGGSATLGGAGLSGGGGELVIRTDTAADALNVVAAISGAVALTKCGAGTLTLSNTANSYGGATTVTAGTLALGASQVIPNSSNLTVAAGGVFDLAGNTETVAGITLMDGTIKNSDFGRGHARPERQRGHGDV